MPAFPVSSPNPPQRSDVLGFKLMRVIEGLEEEGAISWNHGVHILPHQRGVEAGLRNARETGNERGKRAVGL